MTTTTTTPTAPKKRISKTERAAELMKAAKEVEKNEFFVRGSAVRAAQRILGRNAKEGVDFEIKATNGAFTYIAHKKPESEPEAAEPAKIATDAATTPSREDDDMPTKKTPKSKGKPAKATAKRTGKTDSPLADEVAKLASRKDGATRAELEELTGWKHAGWPWLFYNKKTGRGIAPARNMKLEIIKRPAPKDGGREMTAYKLVPLKAA